MAGRAAAGEGTNPDLLAGIEIDETISVEGPFLPYPHECMSV